MLSWHILFGPLILPTCPYLTPFGTALAYRGTGAARLNALMMEETTPYTRLVPVPVPVQGWSTLAGGTAGVSFFFLLWSREGAELTISYC